MLFPWFSPISSYQGIHVYLLIAAHIFFDDCMDRGHPRTQFDYVVNDFVKSLVETVDDSARYDVPGVRFVHC